MRFLVVSDLHGDLGSVREAIDHFRPDALLCTGDWGEPEEVSEAEIAAIAARLPLHSTFGNHDPIERLGRLRSLDGSPILLGQGEVRIFQGLIVAAIGGIWAKSHRKPYYVTDEDVAELAGRIAECGPVDVLLTHACPIGLADLTLNGMHGGQRCFLEANKRVAPRIHLCGHIHVAQEKMLRDGRQVLNVGATPDGSVVVIEVDGSGPTARLDRFERGARP
jgi:Icc-related predicted phosphoesterase